MAHLVRVSDLDKAVNVQPLPTARMPLAVPTGLHHVSGNSCFVHCICCCVLARMACLGQPDPFSYSVTVTVLAKCWGGPCRCIGYESQ
jgi:hypothetical protein